MTLEQSDSITFEMTDALLRAATREAYVAKAREQAGVRHLVLTAGSGAVFLLAVERDAHWVWWVAGVPVLIAAVLAVAWLALIWLVPRSAPRRLARLPHRQVRVDLGPRVVFATANERLEVAWREVQAIRGLPSFWVFVLHTGLEIPVPREKLSEADIAALRARMLAG